MVGRDSALPAIPVVNLTERLLLQLMLKMDRTQEVIDSKASQSICLQEEITQLQSIPANQGSPAGGTALQG